MRHVIYDLTCQCCIMRLTGTMVLPYRRDTHKKDAMKVQIMNALTTPLGVCSKVVEWATHVRVYAGLSPTGANHCKDIVSALSCSLNDVK